MFVDKQSTRVLGHFAAIHSSFLLHLLQEQHEQQQDRWIVLERWGTNLFLSSYSQIGDSQFFFSLTHCRIYSFATFGIAGF